LNQLDLTTEILFLKTTALITNKSLISKNTPEPFQKIASSTKIFGSVPEHELVFPISKTNVHSSPAVCLPLKLLVLILCSTAPTDATSTED
jgi:hypothetical protein